MLDKFASSVVMHMFHRPNLILLRFFFFCLINIRLMVFDSILYENVYPNMLTWIDLWQV